MTGTWSTDRRTCLQPLRQRHVLRLAAGGGDDGFARQANGEIKVAFPSFLPDGKGCCICSAKRRRQLAACESPAKLHGV